MPGSPDPGDAAVSRAVSHPLGGGRIMRKYQKGFTLMELMVVIVIVAILAAAALPLYTNYVKDSKRTEAKGAIGAVITAEQTYFQKAITGGAGSYTTLANLNVDLTDTNYKWTITIPTSSTTSFTVLATGVAG